MEVAVGSQLYVRKMGAIADAGHYIKKYGKKACIVGGKTALSVCGDTLVESLSGAGMVVSEPLLYGGESSWSNIEDLSQKIASICPDIIIAVGGGKAIDTVKAVAYRLNLPLAAVPTIASTCAAVTPISIIYDDEGAFIETSHQSVGPSLVLVDISVLLQAPEAYLMGGIGDTLAKEYESSAASKKYAFNMFTRGAVKMAEGITETLLEYSLQAIQSVKTKQHSSAFDHVTDAVIFAAGTVSGYGGDLGRTAAAHAIYSGLTLFPETHQTTHGEVVAFGILAQLVMEKKTEEEINKLLDFYLAIGLPVSLEQIGLKSLSASQWEVFGSFTVTVEDMNNMPFTVTPEMVIEAVQVADSIGSLSMKHKNNAARTVEC